MCNVLMMREMDKRFASEGMVVSALFPGCIAESPLFREKRGWFRAGFPVFQKLVTKQFVSTEVRRAVGNGLIEYYRTSRVVFHWCWCWCCRCSVFVPGG